MNQKSDIQEFVYLTKGIASFYIRMFLFHSVSMSIFFIPIVLLLYFFKKIFPHLNFPNIYLYNLIFLVATVLFSVGFTINHIVKTRHRKNDPTRFAPHSIRYVELEKDLDCDKMKLKLAGSFRIISCNPNELIIEIGPYQHPVHHGEILFETRIRVTRIHNTNIFQILSKRKRFYQPIDFKQDNPWLIDVLASKLGWKIVERYPIFHDR